MRGHGLGTLLRVVLAGVGGGVVFLALFGYRTDYAGHYLAGFGGTLGLLALPMAVLRRRLAWEVVWIAAVAILVGAALEATIFRLAIFDPVDFYSQSLGAVLAALAVLDRRPTFGVAAGAAVLALVFLLAGGVLAFA